MSIKKNGGFTLIELMIVVAIIGILAAVAIPRFGDILDRARESNLRSELGTARTAFTLYYGRTGVEPSGLSDLQDRGFLESGYSFSVDVGGTDITQDDLCFSDGRVWINSEVEDTDGNQINTW